MQPAGPVRAEERIPALDVLRGFALLGILLLNILDFGLHGAFDDPTVAGGATGVNLWTWIVMHVLAEGKMRCLFSMIFGAGIVLLTSRMEEKGTGARAADIFFRRNLWLVLLGVLHAYLLWHGEILYSYGLCALLLYPFRHLTARRLLAAGFAMMLGLSAASLYRGHDLRRTMALAQEAARIEKSGGKLSERQEEAKQAWEEIRKRAKPTPEEVEKTNRKWRGSLWDVLKVRAGIVRYWHSMPFYHYMALDLYSMMFLGMGFFKLGVFSGARSTRFYAALAALGYLSGMGVNGFTAWLRVSSGFDLLTITYTGVTYDFGRLSIALAHAAALMLLHKAGLFNWVLRSLAAVGQMALSNYLLHSIVCSTIFCGYGLALFGRLERYQLYYIVAGLWIFQLIVSPIWLKHFQFGPAEWAWRSLTYWKRQPMRLAAGAAQRRAEVAA
jgi:uncharacterized protein